MIAFVIWTIVVLVFVLIGISTWRSEEPAGFFVGVKPPEIPEKNVKNYNHAVAIIWFVFSAFFEILGIPLAIFEQNSPQLIISLLGAPVLVIGIIVAYLIVQRNYMKC